jgi:thiamine transporter
MKTKARTNLLVLTECSIMIALATVLSIVKLFEMPHGGSITLASMLPMVIIAYRHGPKVGMGAALVSSVIQMLLGMSNFSYFTTWYSIVVLALLDYIVAFAIFGLTGIFRGVIKKQNLAMTVGAVLASAVRYLCHVISGATIWAGLSIPTEAALVYSLSYNATYMIPETIILVLTTVYIASALDFTKRIPVRISAQKLDTISAYCYIGAGLSMLAALITDTVLVFSKLQNYGGEFFIHGLSDVNWLAVGIVSVVAIVISTVLVLVTRRRAAK